MANKYEVHQYGTSTPRVFTSMVKARAFAIKELEAHPRMKQLAISVPTQYGLSNDIHMIFKESGKNGNEYYDCQVYKGSYGRDYGEPRVAHKNGTLGKLKWAEHY